MKITKVLGSDSKPDSKHMNHVPDDLTMVGELGENVWNASVAPLGFFIYWQPQMYVSPWQFATEVPF